MTTPTLLPLWRPSALLALYLGVTCAVQLEASAVGLVRWSDYSVLVPVMAAALLPVRHTLVIGASTLATSVAIYGFAISGVSDGGRTVVICATALSLGASLAICRIRWRLKAGTTASAAPAGNTDETPRAPTPGSLDPTGMCASQALASGQLPGGLPGPAAVELAYCDRNADGKPQAHWLDAIPLPGARVALVAGSVAEGGAPAPALVAELRAVVRTLADIDVQPEEVLTHLQDILSRLRPGSRAGTCAPGVAASCLYAVYDPVSADCTLACAGHPLPMVVTPEGVVRTVDLPVGLPLGRVRPHVETAEIRLAQGSVLLLHAHPVSATGDFGAQTEAGLPEQFVGHRSSLADTCRSAVEALLAAGGQRQLGVIGARTRTFDASTVAHWDLPADPAAVSVARHHVTGKLSEWGLDESASTMALIVSELVTNAIRHAQPPVCLRLIRCDAGLTCEVTDGSTTAPHLRRARTLDEGGRGLFIVAQLTQRWGTRHHSRGKTIWAEQPHTAGESPHEGQSLPAGMAS
ncbi:ATP-binding SpoIIE family protein phosphatase [Streptomyces sp. NPDC046977]|uniref:ATP-binding SpoIIE family protein phosphatase n=1 Tax=Streptomyces sp. NPDC046977 TaxID=3154703 RepID=UPI0034093AB0